MACPIDLSWVYSLSFFALGITVIMTGMAYALGQALSNPRLNVWAKGEIFQVFVSIFLVMLILYLNDSFCTFSYSDLAGLSPAGAALYTHPPISGGEPVYDVAEKYLMNLGAFSDEAMRAVRSANGLMEIAGRYSRSPCVPPLALCLLGQNSLTNRPYSGSTLWMQVGGLALYTNTISYLTVLIQIAFIKFITTRGILLLLPLAIIFRSLPFMRQLGGGLIAIGVAVFLLYPGLLVVESLFWNPYSMLSEGELDAVYSMSGRTEFSYSVVAHPLGSDYPGIEDSFRPALKASAVALLSSTFLFAFNIIAITAAAREFGRLLGQEVDLSRLVQIL
ncbi:MAG: hypothetical protein AB1657_01670 [Candidatus Micrarchaeota archaeon]